MDIESRFLRAMATAIDDYFMGAWPKPDDRAILAIAPELACLLASPKELEEEEENAVSEQRWIPIEDCSPTPSEIGLVWDGQTISFAWCKDGETPFSVEDAVARGITHWMPLPPPPETTP